MKAVIHNTLMPVQPDFVKLADAYGVKGYRINTLDEANAILEEALIQMNQLSLIAELNN